MNETVIIQTPLSYGISQEAEVISILSQYGTVSVPFGNTARYDCILDLNNENKFIRIQTKSLNILSNEDSIVIPMKNQSYKKGIKPYTKEQVDYIAIVYNHQVFLFEPQLVMASFTVRINKPAQCNQHWLYDYELTKILNIQYTSWINIKAQQRGQKTEKVNTCNICGSIIDKKAKLCQNCYHEQQKKNIPPKEELEAKIGKFSFCQLGRDYGVSDNAVRKWCKKYGLPTKRNEIHEWLKK